MHVPRVLGIILDGNRRWARQRGLPTREGHAEGARRVRDVVDWAKETGHITDIFFYTFSTENWKRNSLEIEHLLLLMELFFKTRGEELARANVRIRIAGQRERFSPKLRTMFAALEERTKNNTGITVWFGLSYGGRAEILDAHFKLANEKKIPTEAELKAAMWTADLPDPDIIVRTGGEQRLSNFLTWGSVYAELFFTKTLWPDMTREEFTAIIREFGERQRRMGA